MLDNISQEKNKSIWTTLRVPLKFDWLIDCSLPLSSPGSYMDSITAPKEARNETKRPTTTHILRPNLKMSQIKQSV